MIFKQRGLFVFGPILLWAAGFVIAAISPVVCSADDTRLAYVKIADLVGYPMFNLEETIRQDSIPMKMAKWQETYWELRKATNVDVSLSDVINQIETAKTQMDKAVDEIKKLPDSYSLSGALMMEAGYFATMKLDRISDEMKIADASDNALKALRQEYIKAAQRYETERQLLPSIAQRFAGPLATNNDVIYVFQGAWGGCVLSDWLKVANRSATEFHNCTIVVSISGKSGETIRNVHFLKVWPKQKVFVTYYDLGDNINGEVFGRSTVPDVQKVEVDVFADECTIYGLSTPFTRDQMISKRLKDGLVVKSSYNKFSKGLIFDSNRSVALSWEWEQMKYLPKGNVIVTLKNGERSQKLIKAFDRWPAGNQFQINFENAEWEPTEWSAVFEFDSTSAACTYNWRVK